MNLREDEIAFLGTERCYCGHLQTLHDEYRWCLVDEMNEHHFCSAEEKTRHYELQSRMKGSPLANRHFPCPKCQEEAEG